MVRLSVIVRPNPLAMLARRQCVPISGAVSLTNGEHNVLGRIYDVRVGFAQPHVDKRAGRDIALFQKR